MSQVSNQIQKKTKPFHYAVGMFGTSIPINMFKTYALFFYVDHLAAIDIKQFGLILAIYTVLDALDNPVYGYLSDRTRTKWGRRKPWLLLGAPALALAFIAFFSPPNIQEPGIFIYALLLYCLTGTLDSLINANYGALFPELFAKEAERSKTNALRQVFQLIAMVLSIALTPVITDKLGYQRTAFVYALLAVVVISFMAFNVHEPQSSQELEKPQFMTAIKHIIRNPKFWIYGLSNAAFFAAFAVLQQSVSFYTKYVIKGESIMTTIMLGTVILIAMISIPLWMLILRRRELLTVWRISLITVAIALIPLYLFSSLVASITSLVILGFGYGGTLVTSDLVGARILDDDFKRHGLKREGIFTSLLGVLNKTSGLMASFAFFFVNALYQYVDGENPGPYPDQAARFLISVFPFIVMLISILFSFILHVQKGEE